MGCVKNDNCTYADQDFSLTWDQTGFCGPAPYTGHPNSGLGFPTITIGNNKYSPPNDGTGKSQNPPKPTLLATNIDTTVVPAIAWSYERDSANLQPLFGDNGVIQIGYSSIDDKDTITILNYDTNATIATLTKKLKYYSCQNGNCTTTDGNNGTYYQNSCNIYCK